MSKRQPTLRRQIVTSFLSFAVVVSLLFAGSSFLVAYVVEDALFKDAMELEAARQQEHWRSSGTLAPPHRDVITIHTDVATMPRDLKDQLSPSHVVEEYRGEDGRYYHVLPFPLDGRGRAYAVAEVGNRLVVRALRGELVLLVLLGALGMLLFAAALGYWLAVRATSPLSRLVEAVSEVQPGSGSAISPEDYPDNEVGTLARTLQLMLERTRAFVERESRFTRDASHELRTPLAVIMSSVELVESKGGLPPSLARPMQRIGDAVRQMAQSVDLLLLLAREERAQSPHQDVPLLPLVERLVLAESARHGGGDFKVRVSIAPDCRTRFNEAVAATILSNLIGNAFRHNSRAHIVVEVDGSDIVIRDSGHGIPDALLAGLDQESAASSPQRGLGLSIVSRLCRVHSIPFGIVSSTEGTTARVGLLRNPPQGDR